MAVANRKTLQFLGQSKPFHAASVRACSLHVSDCTRHGIPIRLNKMNNESDEESDISTDEYEVDHDDTHSTTDESISDSDRDSDGEFQGK